MLDKLRKKIVLGCPNGRICVYMYLTLVITESCRAKLDLDWVTHKPRAFGYYCAPRAELKSSG